MRFEDSPDLFGYGAGVSTVGPIECEFCGTVYNEDAKEDEEGDVSVCWTTFAGKQICECCFEKIEAEILHRMGDILKWYRKMLNRRKEQLEKHDKALKKVEP